MPQVVLDTTAVSTTDELHELLKRRLGLPDHYGKNLDALWDCLTGWIELPLTVKWEGFTEARRAVGESADQVLETFRRAERELEGFQVDVVP